MRGRGALRIQRALEDLHLGAHLGGRLIAQIAVLLQRAIEDALELRRQVWIQLIRRRRVAIENAFEDHGRSIPVECLLAGCRLVERCAQRKQVGAPVEFFSPSLLGRHIGDRPQGASGTGQVFQCFFRGGGVQVTPGVDLGQTEIEQLYLACFRDEDVGRLDIPVHDAFAVGGVKRVGDLDPEVEHEVDG